MIKTEIRLLNPYCEKSFYVDMSVEEVEQKLEETKEHESGLVAFRARKVRDRHNPMEGKNHLGDEFVFTITPRNWASIIVMKVDIPKETHDNT